MGFTQETVDGVTRITLDRPPLNALDLETIQALETCFQTVAPDQPVVLRGAGRAFSAGVDTRAFGGYGAADKKAMILAITRMTAALLAVPVPVIAAVNGPALGGGLVLALCADGRVATDSTDAKFGLTEARAGVPFPIGPVDIIRHELSPPLLRQLTLSSRVVSAQTLHAHTVFDDLMPVDALDAAAIAMAQDLASQPAFPIVKQQIRGPLAARLAALAAEGRDPLTGWLGL